jgi:hypothetical protein
MKALGAMFCKKGDPSLKWFDGRVIGTNNHRKWWVYANSQPFLDGKFKKFIKRSIPNYEYPEYPQVFVSYRNGE